MKLRRYDATCSRHGKRQKDASLASSTLASKAYCASQGNNQQNGQEEMRQIQGDVYIGPYCAASGRKIHLGLFLSRSYARVPVNIFTGIFAREHIRPHNSPLHGILLHGT